MTEKIHFQYLEFAALMADKSGDILRKYFKSTLNTQLKADQSPVTEADLAVEKAILLLIKEKFPEHGIIGEETGEYQPDAEYKWIIDPIDGTKSFIAGYPIFTTLIALLHKEKPILGIIDQPILKERWMAVYGEKTTFNNQPLIALQGSNNLATAQICTTSTGYFSKEQEATFRKLKEKCQNTVLGGDAYAYAMLANGNLDIVIDAGMKPYDFLALAPIIEGSGGVICDWQGHALNIRSNGTVIACRNKTLLSQALEML